MSSCNRVTWGKRLCKNTYRRFSPENLLYSHISVKKLYYIAIFSGRKFLYGNHSQFSARGGGKLLGGKAILWQCHHSFDYCWTCMYFEVIILRKRASNVHAGTRIGCWLIEIVGPAWRLKELWESKFPMNETTATYKKKTKKQRMLRHIYIIC